MTSKNAATCASPWPHRWAVGLACATFPLVWVGGLVTTTKSGMAVPDWPSTYGYNLFLYPWTTWLFGPWDLFIEHGHRLLGAAVGLLTIGLLVTLWRCETRAWVKWLGVAALALVCGQGALGGARVLFDERLLAMTHGCVGPLFFSLTVTLAVVTSARWRRPEKQTASNEVTLGPQAYVLQAMAALTTLLVYAQLVLGALVRHVPVEAEPSVFATRIMSHVTLAGVLAIAVAALAWYTQRHARSIAVLRRLSWMLAALLVVQIGLGMATWAVKFSVARWFGDSSALSTYTIQAGGWLQTHVVTAHMATGSLLLATSLAYSLHAFRCLAGHAPVAGAMLSRKVEVAL